MDIILAKVLSLLTLFLVTSLAGILPIVIVRQFRKTESSTNTCDLERKLHQRHGLLLSLLLNFGGGVLLSVCLVHLLPEIREQFVDSYVSEGEPPLQFPLMEVVLCLGFFLVYGIEEAITIYLRHRHCHSHLNGSGHDHSPAVATCENAEIRPCSHGSGKDCEARSLIEESSASTSYGTKENVVSIRNAKQPASDFQGLILIIALSFHAIFEGMSIGLQDSSFKVWTIFLGMSVHKVVLAFCIGLETLLHGSSQRLVVLYMVVFALMTPLGGLIASVVDSVLTQSHMSLAVLQAISAGTVLYVTFFEIFFPEKRNEQPGLLKLGSALVGFALMSALTLLE